MKIVIEIPSITKPELAKLINNRIEFFILQLERLGVRVISFTKLPLNVKEEKE
jgi:hypothetical protein